MAMLRSLIWLGCLAQRVISAPVENQQALLSPSAIEVLDSEEYILRVTTTVCAAYYRFLEQSLTVQSLMLST